MPILSAALRLADERNTTIASFAPIGALQGLAHLEDLELAGINGKLTADRFSFITALPKRSRIDFRFIDSPLEDFAADGESRSYVESQLEEQDENVIDELITATSRDLPPAERLLAALVLVRIVFYPDRDDPMFAVFDYSIGEDLSDELLAVKLRKNGVLDFAVES